MPSLTSLGFPLLVKEHFTYAGAFRVPSQGSYDAGGFGLMWWPARNSLLMTTCRATGAKVYWTGELAVPTLLSPSSVTGLLRATQIQAPLELLKGKRLTVDGSTANGVELGAHLIVNGKLVINTWTYYDGQNADPDNAQSKTHFVVDLPRVNNLFTSLVADDVTGPYQVGDGFVGQIVTAQTQFRIDMMHQRIGGFVGGYMCPIPAAFQPYLGGHTHLTGMGGGVSVLSRTSAGPSVSVFTPTDLLTLGTPNPSIVQDVEAKVVMGYPNSSSDPNGPFDHDEMGDYDGVQGGLYNGTVYFRAMIWPENTRSILFFGYRGMGNYCYGDATADPKLHFQQSIPGRHWCYNPPGAAIGQQGPNGYPVRPTVWAYDVVDFVACYRDVIKPWQVKPYANWLIEVPFAEKIQPGAIRGEPVDMGVYSCLGATYDPATQRVYFSILKSDVTDPIIHALTIAV